MKNILKRLPKKLFAVVATFALVAGVASQAIAGFGPDRPTRQWTPAENGFDYVTFNSYTGVPNGIGDEREFFRGSVVGPNAAWTDPVSGVTHDTEIEMKIYVHNDADPLLNDAPGNPGIARNVTVKAELPTGSAQSHQAKATVSADNAQPGSVYDTLDMTGLDEGFFEIEYIPGSAKMFNHEDGQTTPISDSLVTTGVNIGDQKGCFKYLREITFRVKAKVPSYSMQKTARIKGESSDKFRKVVNAKPGDEIEWRIWFAASGTANLKDVTMVDDLPSYVNVVGDVEMDKGVNTVKYGSEAVQQNGTYVHINMGDFYPGDDAYVYFTTKIQDVKELECGVHQIANVAYIAPKGFGALNDDAKVNVIGKDNCDQPKKPVYVCESVTVEKLGGRKVRVNIKAPASNGAVFKQATVNYGDGSEPKTTTNLVDEYEYKADGTYKITVQTTFTVDGKDKTVSSEDCEAMVTFKGGEYVPPTTPELPKTGAGSVIGLFAVITSAAAIAHNVLSRRTVR